MELSVVIITHNEERNIGRCLASIQGLTDDVVVMDSGSTDSTLRICRDHGVRVYHQDWLGYSNQKNLANSLAKYEWILSLDADEAPDTTLHASILRWKQSDHPGPARFKRMTNYCGHFVKHGSWYPDIKVRIFHKEKHKWQGSIHEVLSGIHEAEVPLLEGDCLHYSYYTIDEHRRQSDKFTTIAARDLFERRKRGGWVKLYLSPLMKFVGDYFLRLGFLDGYTGFTIARLSAYATYTKYRKLSNLWKQTE
jgi:glycosyltransferase involved in cell wall biosynthesis